MTSSNQSPDMSNQAAKLLEDPSFSIVDREEFVRLAGVVIANTNDIVVITDIPTVDQEPRIVYVNEAFVRETGYAPHEVLGKNPRMLQGPRSDL